MNNDRTKTMAELIAYIMRIKRKHKKDERKYY